MSTSDPWLEGRIGGAPAALLTRVEECMATVPPAPLGTRLARAGELALQAAIRRGSDREAALDLLAADALITLALLESAQRDPSTLGDTARHLRDLAAVAA